MSAWKRLRCYLTERRCRRFDAWCKRNRVILPAPHHTTVRWRDEPNGDKRG